MIRKTAFWTMALVGTSCCLSLLPLAAQNGANDLSTQNPFDNRSMGSGGGGGQPGMAGRQQQDPNQMAQQLMGSFDADKNGSLSQEELAKAMEFLQRNRPRGGQQGNMQGQQGGMGSGQGNMQGQQGGMGSGQGNMQGQRSGAEHMATRLVGGYDADKDGKLSQEELTKALDSLHKNRPGRNASSDGAQGDQQQGPSSSKIAAQMVEKFSSDKKGLSQEELTKALEDLRSSHERAQQGRQDMRMKGQSGLQGQQ